MRNFLLTLTFIILNSSLSKSQDTLKTKYYASKEAEVTSSKKNAKLVEFSIKESDKIIRYEMIDLESSKLLRIRRYKDKDKVPTGKWFFASPEFSEKLLEFEYMKNEYSGYIIFDFKENKPIGNVNGNFKAPKFSDPNIDFLNFVGLGVNYPLTAKENNIYGKVISQFIVNPSGEISGISIIKGVDPALDFEVAKVVNKSPKWIPAELDGKKIPVVVIFRTEFKTK
jgi:TonB family protein